MTRYAEPVRTGNDTAQMLHDLLSRSDVVCLCGPSRSGKSGAIKRVDGAKEVFVDKESDAFIQIIRARREGVRFIVISTFDKAFAERLRKNGCPVGYTTSERNV